MAFIPIIISFLTKYWKYFLAAGITMFCFYEFHSIESRLHAYETQKTEISQLKGSIDEQNAHIQSLTDSYNQLLSGNNNASVQANQSKKTFTAITQSKSTDTQKANEITQSFNSAFDGIGGQ
ncbi:hypothetical protein [Gluconacetobacter diazotrophicus]|uniref:hypothetical protein n=1 Tax=Gluconacetobacter diazotrophicus TaxID=33996 RepID=UPI00119F6F00|nr:hypothetical protein [Gluconacetobacter diazotrophicus]